MPGEVVGFILLLSWMSFGTLLALVMRRQLLSSAADELGGLEGRSVSLHL